MQKGFSLLEILISLSITLVIGAAVFQLFQQNERVFYDQNLVTEMQQGARAALFQAAGEIRMAGQGVPIYAETYGTVPSEETVAILAGSNSTRINFRTSLAPAETYVTAPRPASFTVGTPVTLIVDDATGLYNAVGGGPAGRFVYLWGTSSASQWNWVRASINSIVPSAKTLRVTVASIGPIGAAAGTVQFPSGAMISLEEAVALYQDSSNGSMRRTTASSMVDPVNPSWAPANEVATNVTLLRFEYFDHSGNVVNPDTLANRARIGRVDIRLVSQTAAELRNRTRPSFALFVRTNIRNATIH
jgi:prepilin-type N-terminal cleavage/methylation domain-containing protein